MPYIFIFPNQKIEDYITWLARTENVDVTWVAIDPYSEYEHEYQYVDEGVWDSLSLIVSDTINEELDEGWPQKPFSDWNVTERRQLITVAVECGFLGGSELNYEKIARAFKEGRLPNSSYTEDDAVKIDSTDDIHIYDASATGVGICGVEGRTMSWHEIKRGRITCGNCLMKYDARRKPLFAG